MGAYFSTVFKSRQRVVIALAVIAMAQQWRSAARKKATRGKKRAKRPALTRADGRLNTAALKSSVIGKLGSCGTLICVY